MPASAFPFFVVGSARSGTTMLRLILNAHPEVAVPPESRFVVELYRDDGDLDVDALLAELASHRRFQAWELPIDEVRAELEGTPSATFRDVMAATYRAYARSHNKTRWGDKTPRYVEDIDLLARIFDDARFIHLIRDGRNVALSYADVPFGPKTVPTAADLWASRVAAGMRSGRRLRHRYLEMRYEDLAEDTAGEVKTLCEFLELDFDPGMLEYRERARDSVLPRAAAYNPNVTREPVANVRSWESDMPAHHVEVFEAVAGPVLSDLAYPRRYPRPGRRARLEASLGRAGLPITRLARGRVGEKAR